MLIKLLKYDLKWTIKNIDIFLGLGLFFGIVGRILELSFDSLFFDVVIGICKGAGLSLTISALVNAIIRSWVRLTINLYKDEAYLSNTLPIKRSVHLLSKCLNAIICVLIVMIVLVINLFIMYYSKETLEWLKSSLNILSSTFDTSVIGFFIIMIGVVLLEVLFIIGCGYFGIIFGHIHNYNKGFYSFLYGFISYLACTLFTVILLMIGTVFNEGLHTIIFMENSVSTIDFSLIRGIMIFAFVVYAVYVGILYVVCNYRFKKGINID